MKIARAALVLLPLLFACDSRQKAAGRDEATVSDGGMVSGAVAPAPEMAMRTTANQAYAVEQSAKDASSAGSPSAPPSTGSAGAVIGAPADPAMIIRTGQAVIQVDSLEIGIARLRQLATRVGGFVASSSMQGGDDQMRSATLEIKLPAARFDLALTGLAPLGKVESVNVQAEDVGEEFVDVSARVANSKRLEERLITLLATRTGKLQDVLAVERELARVREEIERQEGRLRYLRTRSAVSTLNVTLHEPPPVLGTQPGENPIADAFRRAWRNFVGFVAGFISSLGVVLPLAGLVALGWLGFKRWRRK